jgi:hypothetical protein
MKTKLLLTAALLGAASLSAQAGVHFGFSFGLPVPVVVVAPAAPSASRQRWSLPPPPARDRITPGPPAIGRSADLIACGSPAAGHTARPTSPTAAAMVTTSTAAMTATSVTITTAIAADCPVRTLMFAPVQHIKSHQRLPPIAATFFHLGRMFPLAGQMFSMGAKSET